MPLRLWEYVTSYEEVAGGHVSVSAYPYRDGPVVHLRRSDQIFALSVAEMREIATAFLAFDEAGRRIMVAEE